MKDIYFAKWFPVPGEINDGDSWWYKGYQMSPLIQGAGKQRIPDAAGKEREKVKLFLCSRDIQEHDVVENLLGEPKGTVVHIYPDRIGYAVESDGGRLEDYKHGDVYKVIGEISPDALSYVKEGQEFDEDEVEALFISGDMAGRTISLDKGAAFWGRNPDKAPIRIRIKCPTCGHSH